ncbi:MAG: acylphosphatase [Nanoarchaeota archaeon]
MKCIHLIVSGKVQGVFFRDSTRRKAQELGLNGYAKNLPDENVEVVAEGPEEKINELISFIKNNPGHSKVKEVKMKHKELENFNGFEIKF